MLPDVTSAATTIEQPQANAWGFAQGVDVVTRLSGGEGGIRTREAHHLPLFESGAINHSATSPDGSNRTQNYTIRSAGVARPPQPALPRQ